MMSRRRLLREPDVKPPISGRCLGARAAPSTLCTTLWSGGRAPCRQTRTKGTPPPRRSNNWALPIERYDESSLVRHIHCPGASSPRRASPDHGEQGGHRAGDPVALLREQPSRRRRTSAAPGDIHACRGIRADGDRHGAPTEPAVRRHVTPWHGRYPVQEQARSFPRRAPVEYRSPCRPGRAVVRRWVRARTRGQRPADTVRRSSGAPPPAVPRECRVGGVSPRSRRPRPAARGRSAP